MKTKMTLEESQEYARNQWPNKKEFNLCRSGQTVKAKWLDAFLDLLYWRVWTVSHL